jgi:hypothetical protein
MQCIIIKVAGSRVNVGPRNYFCSKLTDWASVGASGRPSTCFLPKGSFPRSPVAARNKGPLARIRHPPPRPTLQPYSKQTMTMQYGRNFSITSLHVGRRAPSPNHQARRLQMRPFQPRTHVLKAADLRRTFPIPIHLGPPRETSHSAM